MEPFTHWKGIGAPLPNANVDTDAIIAVQHVYTLKKTGLGNYLFYRWRYATDAVEIKDFVLNREPFRRASVLVAGSNFGCGSSREHAVWALADFGIRCIVAPSFASILHENCVKNGILPVTMDEGLVECLMKMLESNESKDVAIDLQACRITFPDGSAHAFTLDSAQRETLLEGLDPITAAERHTDDIAAFQQRDLLMRPWVWQLNR